MSSVPKNKGNNCVLYRQGRPDYQILAAETPPSPSLEEAGSILEETDTGDRYRWTGTFWFLMGGPRVEYPSVVETKLDGEVVSGSVEFTLLATASRNNLVDYFYFVDGTGTPVDATAGTVLITLSPILPLYQNITNNSFNAISARDLSWLKPNGFGKAVSVKFTFTGITGPPTGFRSLITQSTS